MGQFTFRGWKMGQVWQVGPSTRWVAERVGRSPSYHEKVKKVDPCYYFFWVCLFHFFLSSHWHTKVLERWNLRETKPKNMKPNVGHPHPQRRWNPRFQQLCLGQNPSLFWIPKPGLFWTMKPPWRRRNPRPWYFTLGDEIHVCFRRRIPTEETTLLWGRNPGSFWMAKAPRRRQNPRPRRLCSVGELHFPYHCSRFFSSLVFVGFIAWEQSTHTFYLFYLITVWIWYILKALQMLF